MSPFEFYRRIGCDILQFGNYGLPQDCCVQSPARKVAPQIGVEETTSPDGMRTVKMTTPWGALTSSYKQGHPVKYSVETVAELKILKHVWLETRFDEVAGNGPEESFRLVEELIGDGGVYVPTVEPSPVQRLIEYDMGLTNFYYLLQDAPQEVQELLDIMHERRRHEYEILARRTPAEAVIPVENTSSTLTSPTIYERYSLPQVHDYADILHRRGKKLVLHMCGLLKDLLPLIRRAGPDGYNGLTPPPVGDTSFEHALDVLGEDAVIFGGVLDPGIFQKPALGQEEMWRALDGLYTPRLRRAQLVLWLGADGLPTPLERFLWVRDWMEENGMRVD